MKPQLLDHETCAQPLRYNRGHLIKLLFSQIAASFAVIYVYAGELMPTVVRSEAMGISSFVAGLGLLMFPYVNALVSAI